MITKRSTEAGEASESEFHGELADAEVGAGALKDLPSLLQPSGLDKCHDATPGAEEFIQSGARDVKFCSYSGGIEVAPVQLTVNPVRYWVNQSILAGLQLTLDDERLIAEIDSCQACKALTELCPVTGVTVMLDFPDLL